MLVVDFESVAGATRPAGRRADPPGGEPGLAAGGDGANGGSGRSVVPLLFQADRVLDLSVQEPEIEEVVRRIYEGHLLASG